MVVTLFHTDVKLDPEVKRLWLEALRSGEYRQGREVLCTPDGEYCCYGVATELAVRAGVSEWGGLTSFSPHQAHHSSMPGEKVRKWMFPLAATFGWPVFPFLDREDEPVPGQEGNLGTSAAHLNDHGLTLSQIADLIDFWW